MTLPAEGIPDPSAQRPPSSSGASSDRPLARRIAESIASLDDSRLTPEVVDKVKICLLDFVGCAFESRDLSWSRQAVAVATDMAAHGSAIIGSSKTSTAFDAAFANAVMGHGLVREDMHSGSISHLGIVVMPALLALAGSSKVTGRAFINAAMAGYEVGGQIGRAVMDAAIARIHRPTGVTGPSAAAAAAARLLGLSVDATTSALALAANTPVGFNQWAHTGGSEMFFHAGYAARSALTAVRLAQAGAFASPSAYDGEAGLFASLGKRDNAARVRLFEGTPEILSVYHKPVPACNFAQTACQAALRIARDHQVAPERIERITIRVPRAGALYPGCDYSGPFEHILQAKMSIQYNVAAALIERSVSERNFLRLDDPVLARLLSITSLEIDDGMSQAYPGLQGGEVEIRDADGATRGVRLDDVVNATPSDVLARFRAAATEVVGEDAAHEIEQRVAALETADDVGAIVALFRGKAP
ncbi:MAG: MmgE/PrpD family protein [Betaproteobacteria bacterium]|nr:MmgE/PrpD family protein [Betaproteobacteria bacterium]